MTGFPYGLACCKQGIILIKRKFIVLARKFASFANFVSKRNIVINNNLLKQSVLVQTTIKNGKLSIDLRKFNIVVEDIFFVALEWIEDLGEDGLYFSASFSGSPIIARQTSHGTWEKIK